MTFWLYIKHQLSTLQCLIQVIIHTRMKNSHRPHCLSHKLACVWVNNICCNCSSSWWKALSAQGVKTQLNTHNICLVQNQTALWEFLEVIHISSCCSDNHGAQAASKRENLNKQVLSRVQVSLASMWFNHNLCICAVKCNLKAARPGYSDIFRIYERIFQRCEYFYLVLRILDISCDKSVETYYKTENYVNLLLE